MKVRVFAVSLLCVAACSSNTPPPGSSAQANLTSAPDWVGRGSRMNEGIISGVGAVKGVRNAPLARNVAENRARAEISKILDTYSASLMKDYAASTSTGDLSAAQEEQRVVQMVKTFSAQMLQASEVKNHHVDGSGVTYALVELDFERAKQLESVRGILGTSQLKQYVEEHGAEIVEELEAETARPVIATPPSIDEVPEQKVGFDWENGSCDAAYLCGVGRGSSPKAADNDARAEIGRIFAAKVEAVSESLDSFRQELSNKTGESWFSTAEIKQKSVVSTDKMLVASRIAGRSKADGGHVSLALIERAPAAQRKRDQVAKHDAEIDSLVKQAKRTNDPIEKLRQIKYAVLEHVDREAANADLTVLVRDGRGIPAPISQAELLALLAGARKNLRVALVLTGDGTEDLVGCFEKGLTAKQHTLAKVEQAKSEGAASKMVGSYDAIVHAHLRRRSRGVVGGMAVVEMQLSLRLMDGKNGRVLSTVSETSKGTRPTADQAAITANTRLCKKQVPKMVEEVDRYFSRR